MQRGPIIIIDDDQEDQDIIRDVCADLNIPNKLFFLLQREGSSGLYHERS